MASAALVTWYFGRAIRIPFLRATLKAFKIVNFDPDHLKLWNPVLQMVYIINIRNNFSLHRHRKFFFLKDWKLSNKRERKTEKVC